MSSDTLRTNIFLIGYRCTGKSTVGKKLSEKLDVPFYDTDDIVESITGQTISSLVKETGWEHFRQREKEAVRKSASFKGAVISTGGGAVLDAENADLMKKSGILIWLFADPRTIVKRIEESPRSLSQRPAFSDADLLSETIHTLLQREPIYRSLADFSVDTVKMDICETVDEILKFLNKF